MGLTFKGYRQHMLNFYYFRIRKEITFIIVIVLIRRFNKVDLFSSVKWFDFEITIVC